MNFGVRESCSRFYSCGIKAALPLSIQLKKRRPFGAQDKQAAELQTSPPPGRVALVFLVAAGEEQVSEHGDEAGSVIELVPPVVLKHALRDNAHRSDEQRQTRCNAQPMVAIHTNRPSFY